MATTKGFTGAQYAEVYKRLRSYAAVAREFGVVESTVRAAIKRHAHAEREGVHHPQPLEDAGYEFEAPDMTKEQAWDSHADTFERTFAKAQSEHWAIIKRPKGPYGIFHCTDPHVDDNATPLRLLANDIKAAQEMDCIMCHGGDLLNNWPTAGRLAKKYATQECTLPAALLRAEHYIDLMKPHVWTDGNHEEMNGGPILESLFQQWLDRVPHKVIRDYWTARFVVQPKGGRKIRVTLSHKFQKGRSWFHPHHGVIREVMEGEMSDIYMEGHLHIAGVLYRAFPERNVSTIAISSAGYKLVDSFAARISRGGIVPKVAGRAHWVICDDQADDDTYAGKAFENPVEAEAYLSALQNLRAV
jgi:hypothetical protein